MRKQGVWGIAVLFLLVGCGARPAATGGTSASLSAPPTTTPSPAVIGHDDKPGDAAPHEEENNGWKYPGELSADAKKQADAAAGRIRPALEKLRAANRFSPDAVRSALIGLGYRKENIGVREFDQPPGVVYGVQVGSGCVEGDVRPTRVQADVQGPIADWGCMPPATTH